MSEQKKPKETRYPGLCSYRPARAVHIDLCAAFFAGAASPVVYSALSENVSAQGLVLSSLNGVFIAGGTLGSMALTERHLSRAFSKRAMGIGRARPKMVAGQIVSYALYVGLQLGGVASLSLPERDEGIHGNNEIILDSRPD